MSQRAVVYFSERVCRPDTDREVSHYYNKAIWALQKQIPMKVNHERTFWTYRHYCPACSEQLPREGLRFCDRCGQKLDWSNYGEHMKYIRSV